MSCRLFVPAPHFGTLIAHALMFAAVRLRPSSEAVAVIHLGPPSNAVQAAPDLLCRGASGSVAGQSQSVRARFHLPEVRAPPSRGAATSDGWGRPARHHPVAHL